MTVVPPLPPFPFPSSPAAPQTKHLRASCEADCLFSQSHPLTVAYAYSPDDQCYTTEASAAALLPCCCYPSCAALRILLPPS